MKKVFILIMCAVLLFGMIFAVGAVSAPDGPTEKQILDMMAHDWLFTCEENAERCADGMALYGMGQIKFISEDAAREIYVPLKDGLVDTLSGAQNVKINFNFDNIEDAVLDADTYALWDGIEASAKAYCSYTDVKYGSEEWLEMVRLESDIYSSLESGKFADGNVSFMDILKENYTFMLGMLSCKDASQCFGEALRTDDLAAKRNWMLMGASLATFGCEMSIENSDEIVKAAYTKDELKFDREARLDIMTNIAQNAVDVIGELVPEIQIATEAITITTDIALKTMSMRGKLDALAGYMLNPDTIEDDMSAYYNALSNQYSQFTYEISDMKITLDEYNGYLLIPGDTNPERPDYNIVVVPETHNGFPVVAFDGVFADKLSITEITIPSTIESRALSHVVNDCDKLKTVYYNAKNCKGWYLKYFFNDCDSDFKVIFGEDIEVIPERFISNCGITSITFPEGITTIHAGALVDCPKLKEVTIPSTVEIFDIPFDEKAIVDNCPNLEKVYYNAISPEGSYYNAVFSDCGNSTEEMQLVFGADVQVTPVRFLENCGVKTVDFPEGITQIREEAIFGCQKLTSITIPSTVTAFSDNLACEYVFSACENLETVNYNAPNAAGDTGAFVFYNLPSDFQIHFGQEIESIPENFMSMCGLTEIAFPEGVKQIGYNCLVDCDALKTVTVPSTAEIIEYNLITECAGIETVYFNANCTSSANSALISDCGNLTNPEMVVALGENVTTVPAHFIKNCAITDFVYPEGIKIINKQSLVNCSTLETVVIPSTVEQLDYQIVHNCSNLKTVEYRALRAERISEELYLFYNSGDSDGMQIHFAQNIQSLPNRFMYKCSVRSVVLPGGLTAIPEEAFNQCTQLNALTIPQNIATIGKNAFDDCVGLTEIYFNAAAVNALKAGNGVFASAGENEAGITVVIGKNVTKIPAYLFCPNNSFSGDPKITSVDFAEGSVCAAIEKNAFAYCAALPSVHIPESVDRIDEEAFYKCTGLTSVSISDGVSTIGQSAFSECEKLTGITIPDSVTSVGKSVFSDCTGLQAVTIGGGIAQISNYAFSGCTGLTDISIPDNITSIGNYAFSGCSGLSCVTMQDAVTEIATGAFQDCSSLGRVIYCGNQRQWGAISFGRKNELFTDAQRSYHNFHKGVCTVCGVEKCAAHTWQDGYCEICDQPLAVAVDLNGDGKVTAFDAQILAEAKVGLRSLTEEQKQALGDLKSADIVDYILACFRSSN